MAVSMPKTLNLLVLDDKRIRFRTVPAWACIFDAESWAEHLVKEPMGEAMGEALEARLALKPHSVVLRSLKKYVTRVVALGRPPEDGHVHVCLLLDGDGGAMYCDESCRAIFDHTSSAVDVEIVSSAKMAEIVAPYMCYLSGGVERSVG